MTTNNTASDYAQLSSMTAAPKLVRTSTDGSTELRFWDYCTTDTARVSILHAIEPDEETRHICLDVVSEEPMTAAQTRELAAALIAAADCIDGGSSAVVNTRV